MVPLNLCSVVFCGFLMCAYVCRVINKTTFGSFTVLYIQIPYLTLLIQNSGRVIARLGPSRGAIHSSPVFYSEVPNKHAYPNKHVWWKKIKKINKSVGAQ